MLRTLLSLVLLSVLAAPAMALPAPQAQLKKVEEAFKAEAEASLCVFEDPDDTTICFVREVAVQGSWAAARLAYQNQTDSFILFRKPKDKWIKVMPQMMPDWAETEGLEPPISEAVYKILADKLFPPDE